MEIALGRAAGKTAPRPTAPLSSGTPATSLLSEYCPYGILTMEPCVLQTESHKEWLKEFNLSVKTNIQALICFYTFQAVGEKWGWVLIHTTLFTPAGG